MIIIICGVSGCGKTTIGMLLAQRLDLDFYDADDFHPPINIRKMSNGVPLTDDDRKPWLETLAANLSDWQAEGGAVLACSALKEAYRESLATACDDIRWITLEVSKDVLIERIENRKHFFDQGLLASQLDAFESPEYGCAVDASGVPNDIVASIVMQLSSGHGKGRAYTI